MVDDLTPMGSAPSGENPPAAVGDEKPGFLSTAAGKVAVIAAAVFAFLAIAGIVVFVVITFFFSDSASDSVQQVASDVTSSQSVDGSSGEATAAPIVEPSAVSLSSIFTFRDVFDPLIELKVDQTSTETSTTTDGTTTDGTIFTGEQDTLYLTDVVVENGESLAVLFLNGQTYSLAEGQGISGTPWLVLNIDSDSVTMLYGDSQVTLVVGQGITSK